MKILSKLIFATIIFMASCSTNQDTPKSWSLSEDEDLIENKPKDINLKPMGIKPIEIPPNSFPWLPPDKPIIIHTALESYNVFPDPNEYLRDYLETEPGLNIVISLLLENEIFPHNPQERTWIALNIEEMMFNESIHFFEVRPNKNDDLVGSKFDFLWKPKDNFLLSSGLRANQIEIYIDKKENSINQDLPHVEDPWPYLAKRCSQQRCDISMFVWLPEKNKFNTIELKGKYSDPTGPQQKIPILVLVEKSRINP